MHHGVVWPPSSTLRRRTLIAQGLDCPSCGTAIQAKTDE
jgi:hypothetical protein